ncbi:MAG: PLP-dependent aspartate aminotransferase family protein [Verrucomicrobiales bacterium]|nr:PLP-dependent aspartate aminotransferase family protein [Verrucomicrobiales bacterium]MED5585771.1 PLP-dependent aspartate aminotransferase family protein [Verrucomicrobiota bacterium]
MSDKSKESWGVETRAIHTGLGYREQTGAIIPPAFITSTFQSGNPGGFDYTRSGNPNFRNLEETLASLESASRACVFASGVSAITAIVSTLATGDVVVAEENIYGCTFRLFDAVFRKFGVEVVYLDLATEAGIASIAGHHPALVWIESPTNPLLKVIDIAACSAAAQSAGAALVVDNTFASSCVQRPLELGADLSLLSTTKYTNGHSDALGGAVCTRSESWGDKMTFAQKALGLQPSPMDCWLIQRGVKTQALRMERHSVNALAVAEFLQEQPSARLVRYPYLKSHPQYELARRQMSAGSGIVTVDFDFTLEQTSEFINRLDLFKCAESLGGIESLCCHPASMTHASVPAERRRAVGITDSLVRFSVGIETVADLLDDLSRGLSAIGA